MRILLGEMISRKLARELVGHDVSTVQREGWAGLTNGRLLAVIDSLFDAFITMDQGMRHQQRLAGRSFAVVELRASSNDIDDLIPLAPRILDVLSTIQPGEIVVVGISGIP